MSPEMPSTKKLALVAGLLFPAVDWKPNLGGRSLLGISEAVHFGACLTERDDAFLFRLTPSVWRGWNPRPWTMIILMGDCKPWQLVSARRRFIARIRTYAESPTRPGAARVVVARKAAALRALAWIDPKPPAARVEVA